MECLGDVVNRAAGMQVGGFAHNQRLALSQNVMQGMSGLADAALGLCIERDAALSLGRGGPAAGLLVDQRHDRMLAVSDHACRLADRRGTTSPAMTMMRRSSPSTNSSASTRSERSRA